MAIKKTNNMKKKIKQLESAVENSLEEIGVKGVAEIQANTPVDTGTLKRAWTFEKAKKNKRYRVTFGNAIDYSIYVEFKAGRSQGFFRGSMKTIQGSVNKTIKKNLSKI